jgi:hypothetical protein
VANNGCDGHRGIDAQRIGAERARHRK